MLVFLILNFSLVLSQQTVLLNSKSLVSCGRQGDVFDLNSLVLNPDPPERGRHLDFSIQGTLNSEIQQGAIVHVRAKLGFIQLMNQDMDLCEEIKQVGRSCPIPKGPFLLNHSVEIPKEAPPVSR